MPSGDVAAALDRAERSIGALSKALLLGQPDLVESAAADLQQAARFLSVRLQGQPVLGPRLTARLRQVGQGITLQREACARRGAAVERALHSLMPGARPSTYAGVAGRYTGNAKQSGAFKLLSA